MVAPAPGRAPMKNPIAVPRIIDHFTCQISPNVGQRSLNFTSIVFIFIRSSAETRTSPMPNRPMTTTTKETPSISWGISYTKRGAPCTTSMPTVPRAIPMTPLISDFDMDFPPTNTMVKSIPITIRLKNSAGPNFRANFATGERRRSMSPIVPRMPATKEADRGNSQGYPAASLARHLVTVNGGYNGRALTRNIEQDRGRRPAVHGAVVDRAHHDHGGCRVHPEGERNQHRDRGRGTQTGQDSHQRAEEAAHGRHHDIERGESPSQNPASSC